MQIQGERAQHDALDLPKRYREMGLKAGAEAVGAANRIQGGLQRRKDRRLQRSSRGGRVVYSIASAAATWHAWRICSEAQAIMTADFDSADHGSPTARGRRRGFLLDFSVDPQVLADVMAQWLTWRLGSLETHMVRHLLLSAMVLALTGGLTSAKAAVLYDNPYDASSSVGACDWNTACASYFGFGDDYGAQEFNLGAAATLTSATVTELADYNFLSGINWAIYDDSGPAGLPGTELADGSSIIDPSTVGFDGYDDFGDAVLVDPVVLGSIDLAPGTYYFAVQGLSAIPTYPNDPDFAVDNYLAQGLAESGDAETFDGGETWVANYASDPRSGYQSSIAVSLSGISAAPEPANWVLMLGGVALLGWLLRTAPGRRIEGVPPGRRSAIDGVAGKLWPG